jgi:hypothetical protein
MCMAGLLIMLALGLVPPDSDARLERLDARMPAAVAAEPQ